MGHDTPDSTVHMMLVLYSCIDSTWTCYIVIGSANFCKSHGYSGQQRSVLQHFTSRIIIQRVV